MAEKSSADKKLKALEQKVAVLAKAAGIDFDALAAEEQAAKERGAEMPSSAEEE